MAIFGQPTGITFTDRSLINTERLQELFSLQMAGIPLSSKQQAELNQIVDTGYRILGDQMADIR